MVLVSQPYLIFWLKSFLRPTGEMQINGETSLIAISAGLNGQLTGMENIKLKCAMLGIRPAEIKEITPK